MGTSKCVDVPLDLAYGECDTTSKSHSRVGLCSDHWQPPGALLRTLVALAWQIDHETPGSGRATAYGLVAPCGLGASSATGALDFDVSTNESSVVSQCVTTTDDCQPSPWLPVDERRTSA
jgi:hypothetical protein